jgi:hypothetical protein
VEQVALDADLNPRRGCNWRSHTAIVVPSAIISAIMALNVAISFLFIVCSLCSNQVMHKIDVSCKPSVF